MRRTGAFNDVQGFVLEVTSRLVCSGLCKAAGIGRSPRIVGIVGLGNPMRRLCGLASP